MESALRARADRRPWGRALQVRGRPGQLQPTGDEQVEPRVDAEVERLGDKGPRLLCALCRAPITSRGEAREVEGRHQHTFFNPAGVLFEIGCYAAAPGCLVVGQPTSEFAWFSGSRWQYSLCSGCRGHLGWFFTGLPQGPFHGLITNRLVEETEPRAADR